MESKTITVRIPDDLAEWVSTNGDGFTDAIINVSENFRRIRVVSTSELKGVFTSNEWKLIADSLNGSMVEVTFRCNVSAFIAHIQEADDLDGLAEKWNVDIASLISKAGLLKGANIEAIYNRIEKFWSNPSNLEEWADF